MSKFIKLTKLDGGNLLISVDQIIWVVDDTNRKFTMIMIANRDVIENIKDSASEILDLINQ